MGKTHEIFPDRVVIENVPVDRFQDARHMIARFIHEANRRDRTSVILNLNINAANIAHGDPRYKRLLQEADAVFCDGAGIQLAARLTGQEVPTKLGVGYWLTDALEAFANAGLTVYMLGGEPGVADCFVEHLDASGLKHSIIGRHHGYLKGDPALNRRVIDEIKCLKPDILFVGMGMPIQEYWVETHRDELDASVIIPIGAAMDYFVGKLKFCPEWINRLGCEWLYRLCNEPKRLFKRYVMGNPAFLSRIVARQGKRWLAQGVESLAGLIPARSSTAALD